MSLHEPHRRERFGVSFLGTRPNENAPANRSGRGSLVCNFTLAAPRAVAELGVVRHFVTLKPYCEMAVTESQFIHERCLGLIRGASMHEARWEWTMLDRVHDALADRVKLAENECPIVSFFVSQDDWTLMTTHRIACSFGGRFYEISRDQFGTVDFGNFKQDVNSPCVTTACMTVGRKSIEFLYESGYASMAPINYLKFWHTKWPVWKKTYALLAAQQAEQCGRVEPPLHRQLRSRQRL